MSVVSNPPSRRAAPGVTPAEAAARLAPLWREVLHLDQVGWDDDYFDLGGDSALAVELFARIAREFGRTLPLAVLFEAPTVRLLAALLDEAGGAAPAARVIALQPDGPLPPLFLLHDASGDVFGYRRLAQRLGPMQPVYGVRAAGLEGESDPAASVEAMAEAYLPAIRKIQPAGPYYLAGYCGGGTIAYEVAQQLVRGGEAVAFVGLLDTGNWSALPRATVWDRLRRQLERLVFHAAAFARLDGSARGRLWREKVKIARARVPVWRGRLPRWLRGGGDLTRPNALAAVWTANDRACAQYRARPYPGRITDFRPRWQYQRYRQPAAHWERLAGSGCEVRTLPVYPATLLVEPYVAETASALRAALEDARREAVAGAVGERVRPSA
ncbi:MAG: thioesterase domain-containing protein [Terriglobales bacterium]